MAIHRPDLPLSGTHSSPGGHFTVTRCRRCGIVVGYGDRCDFCLYRRDDHRTQPGEYIGRHHSEWSATVDELLLQGDEVEAELLLWRLIDAAEAEARTTGTPPYDRHYTRLVQLAERRNDHDLAARVRAQHEECARMAEDARHQTS